MRFGRLTLAVFVACGLQTSAQKSSEANRPLVRFHHLHYRVPDPAAHFRRTAENPEIRIEKRPALHGRQGMWALIGEAGQVLRRGHELGPILAPIERRLLKLVSG